MRKCIKRFISAALVLGMTVSILPAGSIKAAETGQDTVVVPKPYYEFTFDGEVKNGKVENEGSKTGVTATINGTGSGLGVVQDAERGNKVLNLPGGGLNKGALILPENMFQDVTTDGFAFSFWLNIDSGASQYSRIFSATPIDLNSDNGSSGWNAPEFTFVAGLEGAGDLGAGMAGYHTSIMLPDRASQLKLVWKKQFARGKWQHVTISVSTDHYDIYLDGEKIGITYDRNQNEKKILSRLFENDGKILKSFTHNAIGRSVYSTDNDLKAKIDEFRFYNTALTTEQAKAAYDSYAVQEEVLQELRDKIAEAQQKSISFYTKESYEKLTTAVLNGKNGLDNPVTEANVKRLTADIDTAMQELCFITGVSEDTQFSDTLLSEETKEAKELLKKGGLSTESEKAIEDAVAAAEKALGGNDQQTVDNALSALRKAVDERVYESALRFNMDPAEKGSEVFHGSTGFLYGVSEVNVPSADLLSGISPKILVQKAADGMQHPSGDGYRLTPYLKACGVENIQIYLQDYYLEWPYESKGIADYNEKVKKIVTKMVKGLSEKELTHYSFVIFNEPNSIWYINNVSGMCRDWLTIYKTIKGINPAIKVAGPNFSSYDGNAYNTFFQFCEKNNCLPEYITWHELSKDKLESFPDHCKQVKGYIDTYYKDSGIEPTIFVNETVNFDDVGNPGALVNWLSIFDEEDVYASLPYWGLANSMNELAADTNKPNGAWWVYKWYAQMSGSKAPLTLENIDAPSAYGRLYGLTSSDEESKTIYTLFGGQKGKQKIKLENIRSSKIFEGAEKAHVKIYSTKYTGHHGFAEETPVEFEGNLDFTGDDLSFTIQDAELMDAYFAIVTPATEEKSITQSDYSKNWQQTYEAEDAKMIGGAEAYTKTGGGDLARSNRAEVGGMNSEKDGVKFTVNVPKTGKYRLNIYYSNQAPQVNPLSLQYVSSGGQNRAIGALSRHTLSVDGKKSQEIVYDSTVKWGYYNYKSVYLDLEAGKHDLTLMYKGEDQSKKDVNSMLCALLDKIDLTYMQQDKAEINIEPEELAGSHKGFSFSQEGSYTGAGKVTGSGEFDFYVTVPRDGFYSFSSKGNGAAVLSKQRVNYASDAKAESNVTLDWLKLQDVTLGTENAGMIYLTAGVNRLCLTGQNMVLDRLTFEEVTQATRGNSLEIESENCQLSGNDTKDGYQYQRGSAAVPVVTSNPYASGGKVVEGFRGGKNNAVSFTVNVPEAGDYKCSVYYANNEPAPVMKTQSGSNYVHPYNTDLVERYMQISVNQGTPQTVYFKNTFCWDTFKNTVVDVKLQKGNNTITFTNDNSYKFSALQDDFAPRLDKFMIAPVKTTAMSTQMYQVKPAVDDKQAASSGKTEKKTNKITGVASKIKKTWGSKAFTLKAKAAGTIKYKSLNKKVVTVNAKTGKVKIKGCGKAVIVITASGNGQYKASTKRVTITIVPKKQNIKSLKLSGKNKLILKWKKDKKATGYQISYADNKKMKKAKTKWIKKNQISAILKKLKAGRTYYVKVRAYKKSGKTKIYGSYSKVKKKKLKK